MFKFNNIIYNIKFEKMNKINDINNINRVYKSKNFSLMINFNENLKIDYFEINIKLT